MYVCKYAASSAHTCTSNKLCDVSFESSVFACLYVYVYICMYTYICTYTCRVVGRLSGVIECLYVYVSICMYAIYIYMNIYVPCRQPKLAHRAGNTPDCLLGN